MKPAAGRRFTLLMNGRRLEIDGSIALVGSDPDLCDVMVDDGSVAPQHALLVSAPEGLTLLDFKSGGGTCVNGKRTLRVVLADGDRVELGASSFVVQLEAPAPRASASDAAPKAAAEPGSPAPAPARRRRTHKSAALSPTCVLGLGLIALHDAPTRADLLERAAKLLAQAVPAARDVAAMLLDFEGRRRDGSCALRRTARGWWPMDRWLIADPVDLVVRKAWGAQQVMTVHHEQGPVRSIVVVPEPVGDTTTLLVACSGPEDPELDDTAVDAARVIAAHTSRCARELG